MNPQLWPIESRKQHGKYKYKRTHKLTYTQRQKKQNKTLKCIHKSNTYGHAHTLLPDITTHSCTPRAFAISSPNPDSHQPHSTVSPSPKGSFTAGHQAGLFPASLARLSPSPSPPPSSANHHTHPKTERILPSPLQPRFQIALGEKLSCSCSHSRRLIHSLQDAVRQNRLRPKQWIKMTKSCPNVNELFSNAAVIEYHFTLL